MGTDIHVIIERRQDESSPWQRVTTRGPFERPNTLDFGREDWRRLGIGEVDQPEALTGRNYNTFALLADVRNGLGFTGCKTGDGWTPLAEPRGLPSDCSIDNRDYALGDHSFSYATVAELLAFFETPQTATLYGVMPFATYLEWATYFKQWKDRRRPQAYSGGITGTDIVTIDESDRDTKKTKIVADTFLTARVYVRASWPMTAIDAAGVFYACALPWLTALGDPRHVRMVFGFDS